jgi:hypothetical protein
MEKIHAEFIPEAAFVDDSYIPELVLSQDPTLVIEFLSGFRIRSQ